MVYIIGITLNANRVTVILMGHEIAFVKLEVDNVLVNRIIRTKTVTGVRMAFTTFQIVYVSNVFEIETNCISTFYA